MEQRFGEYSMNSMLHPPVLRGYLVYSWHNPQTNTQIHMPAVDMLWRVAVSQTQMVENPQVKTAVMLEPEDWKQTLIIINNGRL